MNQGVIRYTQAGYLFIDPNDDPEFIVQAMDWTNYKEDFCIAVDFSPSFIAGLMAAGFLVMSMKLEDPEEDDSPGSENKLEFILLPKHHLIRTVLFFDRLHVSKTIKRLLNHYQLKVDDNFELILQRCVDTHGDDWLTRDLCRVLISLWKNPVEPVKMLAFGLYREGKLVAGEVGVIMGRVYTSYSGFRTENSSGSIQIIKTAKYLEETGFAFWDLGMPLEYKYLFGAEDISKKEFVTLFDKAQI